MSADLCKNHYSNLYFAVVTFLTKFKIGAILQKKTCQKSTAKKHLDANNYYHSQNLDGKKVLPSKN